MLAHLVAKRIEQRTGGVLAKSEDPNPNGPGGLLRARRERPRHRRAADQRDELAAPYKEND
jgi:hypothetical protein